MLLKKYILPIIACLLIISSCSQYLADYYFKKGLQHSEKEEFDEAEKYYDKAIRFAPNNGAGYLSRGLSTFNLGYHEKALADFEKGYQLDSLDILANFLIAVTLSEVYGKNEEAISYFDRIIRHYPDYYSAYYGGGVSRYELGDYEGAMIQLQKYLHFDAKSPSAHYYIGLIYKNLGDFKLAKEALNIAAENGSDMAKEELQALDKIE